ncbi:cysteine-rich receptor-like protein kinase 8 [Silene latifolia]|uniref:cysteine-rich receptor-like protein kinase 8 n=1 Tax=Silene latifolia TaxID=37657 RepID=UPI003D77993D
MGIVVAVAVCTSVGLIILALLLWICLRQCRKHKVANVVPTTSPSGLHEAHDGTGKREAEILESIGDTELFVQYDFDTLKIATRDFSDENMLGEGGFGNVYRGTLTNGQYLAIKRLSGLTTAQDTRGMREFKKEARLLTKLQHNNLVRLVGFCSEGDEKLLVYEYMSNSNLDRVLSDPSMWSLLNWATRHHIIIGIARGLQYLHEDSRLIIHGDLKLGNILLDKRMNPKIAEFGIARLFEGADKAGNTVCIVGTQGYMAPEYLMTGDYSDKSDVYSFGIMILEIVSGQKNSISKKSPQKEDFPIHVWRLWDKARSLNLVDPVLKNNYSIDVLRCIQIGLLCVQANAEQRPAMTVVVRMLTDSIDLPLPSAPTHVHLSIQLAYSLPTK